MRKYSRWIITLQQTNGGNPLLTFEVTHAKAEKILGILEPDIKKKMKQMETTSATLDVFFEEEKPN